MGVLFCLAKDPMSIGTKAGGGLQGLAFFVYKREKLPPDST
jgi:hypothetical protein